MVADFAANGWVVQWILVPALICAARVIDVTIGTLRIIFVARGMKTLAPVMGFFEVLVWLVALGQVMQNLTNPLNYLAYGLGFALGNYIGIVIDSKLALGMQVVRVITRRDAGELIARLRQDGFGLTTVQAAGSTGPVQILFSVIRRVDVPTVLRTVCDLNPHAFYSVEDVRAAGEGVFPVSTKGWFDSYSGSHGVRKGK